MPLESTLVAMAFTTFFFLGSLYYFKASTFREDRQARTWVAVSFLLLAVYSLLTFSSRIIGNGYITAAGSLTHLLGAALFFYGIRGIHRNLTEGT